MSLGEVLQALREVLASGERGALATVVRTSGSTPQQPGARLLLRPDGTTVGTVGGGAIEYAIIEALREARRSGQSQLLVHNLGYDLGMCCGGRMEVFVEVIEAVQRLILFGAGHVARATATLARSVGFTVLVVDDREELNSAQRFPGCRREIREPVELLRREVLGEQDWVLIATHDHHLDEETLELCLGQRPRYIGLVGSRRKVFRLVSRISARHAALSLDRVYAPVGVDVGAVGPEEIAVSIVAELLAVRHGKAVPHLRALADLRLHKANAEAAPPDEVVDREAQP